MTGIEARLIAKQYVSEMGEVLPGFIFGLGDEEEFVTNYYFDFIWLKSNEQVVLESPVAGGGRGLAVNKYNGHVEVISHERYVALRDRENKLTDIYQLLSDFKNGKSKLTELRARFDLTSKQLLELLNIIKKAELNREVTNEILNWILGNEKNNH